MRLYQIQSETNLSRERLRERERERLRLSSERRRSRDLSNTKIGNHQTAMFLYRKSL